DLPGSFSGLPRSGGDALQSGRAERSADPELALQLLDDLEVLLPIEGHVEDVEVLLGQAHAAEAVGAVTEVVAHHQVGAVGAVLTLDEVGRGVAALAVHAVRAVVAEGAARAVGALVAGVTVRAEHAVGAAGAAGAGVAAGVAGIGAEGAGELGQLLEEAPPTQGGDRLPRFFGRRGEPGGGAGAEILGHGRSVLPGSTAQGRLGRHAREPADLPQSSPPVMR